VIPVSEKYGIGQVVFSPLAQGVLTGKYRGGVIPEDSRGANEEINQWVKELIAGGVLERVDQLEDIARELGISLAQLSLAWILRESNIASALVGASRPEQVDENVKAVEVELSDDVTARIDELFPVN
ncbi:MAG: aldo/keto reductase, partial [Firmicutes bacterium]|nr:aldo/keto reductase [Bacillota bacterium]